MYGGHQPYYNPHGGPRRPPPPPNYFHPQQPPPNPYFQNPNPYYQLPPHAFFQHQPNPNPNPNQPQVTPSSSQPPEVKKPSPEVTLQEVEQAVKKAHRELLASGEGVTTWKVSHATLLSLKSDSWNSLGFQMQQILSLFQLMLVEGKVNAFIHCFVGVRRITSLKDLDVEICKNEGVQQFDELELGPLLRHPLVIHYFLVPPDTKDIVNITSEQIISYLVEYMDKVKHKGIKPEEFLDFLAEKRSLPVKENLGVRIQNLRMHVTSIREARRVEESTLSKYIQSMKKTPKEGNMEGKLSEQPSISMQKKNLRKRYFTISKRVKSFSPIHKDTAGKHITFISSSEDEDDENDFEEEDVRDEAPLSTHTNSASQSRNISDQRVSNCPYPSVNEEKARLGMKTDMGDQSLTSSDKVLSDENRKSSAKKRKLSNRKVDYPLKMPKRNKLELNGHSPLLQDSDDGNSRCSQSQSAIDGDDKAGYLRLGDDAMEQFITTWKEACRIHSIPEVLDKMLYFYNSTDRRRKNLRSMFKSFPCIGLLHVAVTSVKYGMWDNLYDTLQGIGERECITSTSGRNEPESISIEPPKEVDALSIKKHSQLETGISIDDVSQKISTYFELNYPVLVDGKSAVERQFIFLKNLHECQIWLTKQFSVKKFRSLGYGEFYRFLEEHPTLIPNKVLESLFGDVRKSAFEVAMLQHHLMILLSQAASCLWENESITKEHICKLLKKQFPLISFQVSGDSPLEDFSEYLKPLKNADNFSVLFSATLLGTESISLLPNNLCFLENTGAKPDIGLITGALGSVSANDAIECLLKAPMLSDLHSWTHWDLIYAPSLGPLVDWLLNKVSMKELLCLVTKDGKILRIDHSATVDEFLEALIKASAYEAAVKLLSLFSLYGGERHVPLALLKCHVQRGIEIIMKNAMDQISDESKCNNYMGAAKSVKVLDVLDGGTTVKQSLFNLLGINGIGPDLEDRHKINKAVSVASRFILDCLSYLPSEFHNFAAGVLLSGLQFFINDAPSEILRQCPQTQRRMLHEIGLSLSISEWVADYQAFSSGTYDDFSVSSGVSDLLGLSPMQSSDLSSKTDRLEEKLASHDKMVIDVDLSENTDGEAPSNNANEVSSLKDGCKSILLDSHEIQDGSPIIESIRQEEFGLVSSLTDADSIILKKQHARLGRALQCLSQELYSQDSHFLLELVQNADDNVYMDSVEPTLIFVLQSTGIVVLNNERGFTAQNIRALCDVGNSTKKGLNAGYIGKKGIGFKSVFRVTDAPEIHSNGFHVKFDISEGQIGFVLPTVVAPCDIVSLRRLLPDDQTDSCWNTCIVLPFKSKLRDGMGLSSIVSLFSDLHPSLLLFLHRLQCIKFRNMLNDTYTVMKRENLEDGIVKVSHGEETMSWFVATQSLQANVIRPDVQTTKIAMAFTLKECSEGEYKPHLEQQPVFAFLPLRTYGLKFILQGDFVLPSSREEVDSDSAWNQWLLSEFPGLFVSAQRSFCDLRCFQGRSGRAVAAYMSFVPLVGEVHGFFSQLPRMIISKLRISNCLLVEGKEEWVPPCRVLRNWNKQARILLPDNLLHEHMGLGYLDKDIALSDFLAKALGVNEYGPGILIDTLSSICHGGGVGMKSLGLDWASACLSTLYVMLVHSSGQTPTNAWVEADFCEMLRKIPFIPLSDGTYGSVAEGTIWLTCDADNCGSEGEHESGSFPNLYAKLRIVSPAFLSAAALNSYGWEEITVDNVIKMLVKIGVQRLAAHELVKVHILSALSDDKTAERDTNLMAEYLSFVMLHFQSSCPHCHTERESIISELKTNAFILTNHGYRRPAELPIHFGREFGNPIDMTKFFDATDSNWHEIDTIYLKQSRNNSLSFGLMKWREFFQELDITDFVQTVQVEKNITDVSHTLLRDIMWDEDPIASGFVVKDWESPELVHLLSALSSQNNQEKSQYLLEVLDGMWDGCYSAKVAGCYNCKSTEETKQFKSSFLRSINDVQWMASSIDQKLHYPRDLFYDCEEVRSILGNFAPYAVPQVRSRTISRDIELKARVTIDDALRILEVLQSFEAPVNASIDQMSKFYAFIWRGTSNTKGEIASRFTSGPSIFVPFIEDARNEDVRSGKLFSSGEVCWYDPTGAIDLTRDILLQSGSSRETGYLINMTLIHVYQGLHDFFVKECKVCEIPTSRSYIQILAQLSKVALPSQAANIVFRVLLKWANDLKAGLLEPEDVIYLKECLYKSETAVLPTVQDKWVSLHPSSGLICWSDSEELWKQFKDSDNINFLYFGTLSIEEKEALPAKLSGLMQALGVPSLSEVITREAIFYGMDDCREKALLVNWVLSYAQRYIFKLHPDRYNQLKQSGFEKIWGLRIVVVEKLYYRRAVKGSDNVSSKRIECSCLLQGNTLYIDRASKSHPIFMELSRLFFSGAPERHLANFLHMITTMAESGSTEEQTEFFVVDSQEIPELPDEEPVWFLSSLSTHQVYDGETHASIVPSVIDEQNLLKFKRKPGSNTNWPPADWKTAPDFSFARETRLRTKPAVLTPSDRSQNEIRSEGITFTENQGVPGAAVSDWIIEDTPAESETGLVLNDLGAKEGKALFGSSGLSFGKATSSKESNKASGATIDGENLDRSHFSERDELSFGTPNEQQAALTGRTGELVAFRYFTKKVRSTSVKWVNEETETGLPYDIVIGDREESMEYIEVKATKSAKKDWFAISTREWQFAAEKGDSFSIAHILLTGPNKEKVSVFKNSVRLCQKSMLRLAILMPKSEEGESHVT